MATGNMPVSSKSSCYLYPRPEPLPDASQPILPAGMVALTSEEVNVIQWVFQGCSYRDISRDHHMRYGRVRERVHYACRKLGFPGIHALILVWGDELFREGLVALKLVPRQHR